MTTASGTAKPKRLAGFRLELRFTDECGEGAFLGVVACEKVGDWTPPILFVRFPEPPAAGSRFTYGGMVWAFTKEHESYENLWIEGKKSTREAKSASGAAGRRTSPS